MRISWFIVASIVFGSDLALSGCGDDHHEDDRHQEDGGDHHAGPGACGTIDNCRDTVELDEGLAVAGEDAEFTLTVVTHNALSPDDNEWTVELTDATGDPVADAELTVDVWSVDCMHPGPLEADTVTTDADGRATLHPVTAHGGPWDVIAGAKSGSTTDTITLHLCVPDDKHGRSTDPHDDEADGG